MNVSKQALVINVTIHLDKIQQKQTLLRFSWTESVTFHVFIQSGFSLRSEPTHCGPSCWQWMCFTESAAWTPHELLLSTVFIQLKWNLSRSKKPLIKMWLKLFDRLNLSGSSVVLVFSWVCSLVHLLSWINDKSFWSDQTPSALSYYSLCFWFMLCLYFCLVRFSNG